MEIATFIAALASCLTAIVGLFTIYEMKKQREASYKPFLFFDFIVTQLDKGNLETDFLKGYIKLV